MPTTETEDPSVQTSLEDVWYLKEITFRVEPESPAKRVKIITQNFNGPCSFIAICNILLLRGNIEIQPADRTTVSYEYLSQQVGQYLLTACPDADISAALSTMPETTKGMDLNPLFTAPTAFRPAGLGGELKLFEQTGIKLVHGWLVDPGTPEHRALTKTEDYDTSVNLIVEADHLSKGQLVPAEEYESIPQAGSSSFNTTLSDVECSKVEDAIVIRHFIERTQSQLTYHGLFTLASTLEPGSLVALFRNSHLSVLYKSPREDDSALYSLVTDQVFLQEPSVVWERLEDVDGGSSTFVDSEFVRASPVGGDYAGETAESTLRALEIDTAALTLEERTDRELARQLQAEEDERAHEIYAQRERERERARREIPAQPQPVVEGPKKKKDCIIM